MVLLLCQQAESRVEQLKSLEPHSEEGLIATIEYNKIQVKLHFTPEKITLSKDCVEGELRLLKPPQFETESIVYRYLIAAWTRFLGGKLPNGALPKEVISENNKVYYTLPRTQLWISLKTTFFVRAQHCCAPTVWSIYYQRIIKKSLKQPIFVTAHHD
ncbi:hypothetical protein [Nostoc sp.]|uniref:hypothetical protein n=1 Tax=Nostoc sp. TaxID=1180 RepID=UPI002FF9F468